MRSRPNSSGRFRLEWPFDQEWFAGACNLSVAETQPALNIKDAWLVARCAGARLRDYRDDRVDHHLRPYVLDRMCGARNSGVDATRR
jgi:hypothetical protein